MLGAEAGTVDLLDLLRRKRDLGGEGGCVRLSELMLAIVEPSAEADGAGVAYSFRRLLKKPLSARGTGSPSLMNE